MNQRTRHKRIHTAWVHVNGIPKEAKLICSDGQPIRGTARPDVVGRESECKEVKENLGGDKMFYIMIVVMVSQVYTTVKTQITVHLQLGTFYSM